jgi:hypothetical protein
VCVTPLPTLSAFAALVKIDVATSVVAKAVEPNFFKFV